MDSPVSWHMFWTATLIQIMPTLPTIVMSGDAAFSGLFHSYFSLYDFIKAGFLFLMATGILFIIISQRAAGTPNRVIFYLESVKSGLATALWLWLLLDAILAPRSPYDREKRTDAIAKVAVSGLLLPILYYPTWVFAFVHRNREVESPNAERQTGGEDGETTPLLAS